jgi:hypothetical protein
VRAVLAPDGKKNHIDKPTSFQASARVKREPSTSAHAQTCEKKGRKGKHTIEIQNKEDLRNRELNTIKLQKRDRPQAVSPKKRPMLTKLYTRTNSASGARWRKRFERHLLVK